MLLFTRFVAAAAPDAPIKAAHAPKQPKSGETVVITVTAPTRQEAGDLVLEYQIVEPGDYIDLNDSAYGENWTRVSLSQMPPADSAAPDAAWKVELTGKLQRNRRLVRYRVYSLRRKAVVAPAVDDTQRNFAYFVYDGIPEWRAAINPRGSGAQREQTTFGVDVMRSVQAYHLISKRQSIENVTWRERTRFMDPSRHEYKYTGTLVADGKVYDHVRFRARGGTWRYAMGKNMWKIDFNKGHHLEARDNWGQRYHEKWGKLNLGACIQQADYGMRGEQGMLEALTYRLFNLAGVEASHTDWVQLRIVDEPEESPADQYHGDFWGLFLATEELDDTFLKEHGLPEGNLYKIDFGGPKPEYIAKDAPADRSDVLKFMSDLRQSPAEEWWRSKVDLPRYYSYRAIVECVHHYDIGSGKNYFYFYNPATKRWQVVPWDVDLTWADQMYGDGSDPFYRTGLLQRGPFKAEYEARLMEIRDLLFNPEQTGALIEKYAAVICDPKNVHSIVEADRAKWDYHPIMSSQFVTPGKADPGRFYEQSPTHDFRGMVQLMKQYVEQRGRWIDETLLATAPRTKPIIAPANKFVFGAPQLHLELNSPRSALKVRWRLAEIDDSTRRSGNASGAGRYEIQPLWEAEGEASVNIPGKLFENGRTYRVRARVQDARGQWSHWSEPIQLPPK